MDPTIPTTKILNDAQKKVMEMIGGAFPADPPEIEELRQQQINEQTDRLANKWRKREEHKAWAKQRRKYKIN